MTTRQVRQGLISAAQQAADELAAMDFSQLRTHVREMHPRLKLARSNTELARRHANEHHRFHCSHIHEHDGAGLLAGPGSTDRRPSGWYTGQGVIPREKP